MQSENPFQAPEEQRNGRLQSYVSSEAYPADRCPHCQQVVLFRNTLSQGHPFRFRCMRCQGRSVVEMPGMTAIFSVVVVIALGCAIGLIWLHSAYGWTAISFGFLVFLGLAAWLEWWWYQRVRRLGRFRPILYRQSNDV